MRPLLAPVPVATFVALALAAPLTGPVRAGPPAGDPSARVTPATLASTEGSPSRLELVRIPPWIEAGAVVGIDLRIDPVTPDLEIVVDVHERIDSRIVFDRTLQRQSLGGVLGRATFDVDDLDEDGGSVRIAIDLGEEIVPEPAEPEDAEEAPVPVLPRVPIDQEGVYPIDLRLRVKESDTVTDTLVTHLVVFDEDRPPTRLALAWVWPIGIPNPRLADGVVSEDLVAAVGPAGHLAQFADALATAEEVPLTLAPSPATFDAWAELAAGPPRPAPESDDPPDPTVEAASRLEILSAAANQASRQVVAGTYARVDLVALTGAGLDREVSNQLTRGADTIREVAGIRPDPRMIIADHVDPASLDTLRDGGVDRLVLRGDVLEPVFLHLTLARPFELRARGRTFLAAAADAGLASLLVEEDDGEVVASDTELAHRLLSSLAVVALEAPAEERGVVVVPPPSWRPSASMLVQVLNGLLEHPALRPVTLDAFFGRVEPAEGEAAIRDLRPIDPPSLAIEPAVVRATRTRLDSLATMLPEDDPALRRGDRLLLLSLGSAAQERTASPRAVEYLDGARAVVDDVLGAIRLPDNPGVTLTAREARIPLTFVNESPRPIRVRILLSSDKVVFPDGDTHELDLLPRSTTTQFTVEARTTGAFPLHVEVTSPDGVLTVGEFRLTIRSTAVSGIALTVTLGAGVFLLGWWGNHFRLARRRRREEEAEFANAEPAAGATVTPFASHPRHEDDR